MEKIEKGIIIEIKVPNVEKPIKAVVLDVLYHVVDDREYFGTFILYAQKRLFKAECIGWKIEDYNELGEITTSWEFSEPHYEGTIVDYCEIPDMPSDI